MDVISNLANEIVIPPMIAVRQNLLGAGLSKEEIDSTIEEQLSRVEIANCLKPGMKIAITCGSRGVANIAQIIRCIADQTKKAGAEAFVVPAMGSHGGATAEGQREILARYGVTEASVRCPIKSSMEVKLISHDVEGHQVYIDKFAAEADGIIVVGRIKPHTAFRGPYESGLMKMMVIGLGKQKGADTCHDDGFKNMAKNIVLYGKAILKYAPVLFGVGIIENSKDQTYKIAALKPQEIIDKEPDYLIEAKSLMPRIHFSPIDVLIVDRIGKDISGDGMDPNITGTFCSPYASGGIKAERVVVLDLTDASHGCGIGIGMADITTKRFFSKFDFDASYPNAITSKMVMQAKIPMVLANDREAIQIAIKTCLKGNRTSPRIVRIKDTLHIEDIWISKELIPEAQKDPDITILGEPKELCFDNSGNLLC
ncbi:MAG: lactate racemase domain-containing protein [Flexilinea sp.]